MERSNVNRSIGGRDQSFSTEDFDNEKILTMAGGALLALWGLQKFNFIGLLGAAAGGALLYKGATGSWPGDDGAGMNFDTKGEIDINTSLTIDKPRAELYAYWRNLENLPNFMSHLEQVNETSGKRSHWSAKIPGGVGTIEWDAEITQEEEDRLIAWQSLPDAEIDNSGEVRFQDAGGGRTIVEATISYRPPAGEIGDMASQLLNPAFKKIIKKDLKEFKKFMERGGSSGRQSGTSSRV